MSSITNHSYLAHIVIRYQMCLLESSIKKSNQLILYDQNVGSAVKPSKGKQQLSIG